MNLPFRSPQREYWWVNSVGLESKNIASACCITATFTIFFKCLGHSEKHSILWVINSTLVSRVRFPEWGIIPIFSRQALMEVTGLNKICTCWMFTLLVEFRTLEKGVLTFSLMCFPYFIIILKFILETSFWESFHSHWKINDLVCFHKLKIKKITSCLCIFIY